MVRAVVTFLSLKNKSRQNKSIEDSIFPNSVYHMVKKFSGKNCQIGVYKKALRL
jgi:hypothetical protein